MEVKGDIYQCINVCLPCNLEITIIMYNRDDDDKDFSRPPNWDNGTNTNSLQDLFLLDGNNFWQGWLWHKGLGKPDLWVKRFMIVHHDVQSFTVGNPHDAFKSIAMAQYNKSHTQDWAEHRYTTHYISSGQICTAGRLFTNVWNSALNICTDPFSYSAYLSHFWHYPETIRNEITWSLYGSI